MTDDQERKPSQPGVVQQGTGIGLTRVDGQRLEQFQNIEGLRIDELRSRIRDALASELLVSKYGEEGRALADAEMLDVGPRALQTLVAVMTHHAHLPIKEILDAIKKKNAQLLAGEPGEGTSDGNT
jgi:hypothetical protein